MSRFLVGIGKLFVGRTLSVVSNVLVMMLVSRLSGPFGFGVFATVLTTALFSSIICKFGLEQIAMAEAPRVGNSRPRLFALVKSILPLFGLGIFLNFSVLLFSHFSTSFQVYFSTFQLTVYVAVFVTLFSYQFILGEFFRGRGAFFWASLSKGGMSNSIMLVFLAWNYFFYESSTPDAELLWLSMMMAAGLGALTLTIVFLSLQWEKDETIETKPGVKNLFSSGWYFLLISIMLFLASQSDIWISAYMFGATKTGYYAAAARVVFLATFMASLVNGLFTPKLAKLANGDDLLQFEDTLRAMSFINLLVGVIVIFFLMIFAEPIIYVIFGEGFGSSAMLLRILLFGQVASILVGPVGYALIVLHYGKMLSFCVATGLLIGLGAVSIFSIWGLTQEKLAFSFALGNITVQLAMFLVLKRQGVSALPSANKVRELIYG